MINGVLQCCYTNASREVGNIISSGWQSVCISPDLPPDALAACAKIQNANSSIQNKMIDENGNVLNLLEICGDGSYIYFIRTQYGLLDRLGRANLFSHAFIIPCRDSSAVADPNTILSISNENFKYTEEQAEEESSELLRIPPCDVSSALQKSGLTKETYLNLVKCVYARISDKRAARPLFVQFDGTEEMLRALLFCIYSALPFSFRKRLSAASAQTDATDSMNIVFSQKAESFDLFINPVTGENNILTPRTERRLTRLGFLDYAVEKNCESELGDYFEKLEAKAIELGDQSAVNELILKIAHIHLVDDQLNYVKDTDLDVRLSDALRTNSVGNGAMDEYISKLVAEITIRKLSLTEENEETLRDRLLSTNSETLSATVAQYDYSRLNNLSKSDAASRLAKMPTELFARNKEKLLETPEGVQRLDLYYSTRLDEIGNTWSGLKEVLTESQDLSSSKLTDDKIDDLAWNLYSKSLEGIKTGRFREISSEYKNYVDIMRRLHGARKATEYEYNAKAAFWDRMSVEDIDFDMFHYTYYELKIQTPKCEMLMDYCKLPSAILMGNNEEEFFRKVRQFLDTYGDQIGDQYERFVKKLIPEAKGYASHRTKYFEKWCRVFFAVKRQDVFELLISMFRKAKDKDAKSLLIYFGQLALKLNDSTITSKDILKGTAELVFATCSESDLSCIGLSLDYWLTLGSVLYRNSFFIFDEIKPDILSMDEHDVVAESRYLRQQSYMDEANEYVARRKDESKTVKKWISIEQQLRQASTVYNNATGSKHENPVSSANGSKKTLPYSSSTNYAPQEHSNPTDNLTESSGVVPPPKSKKNSEKDQRSGKKSFLSGIFGKK